MWEFAVSVKLRGVVCFIFSFSSGFSLKILPKWARKSTRNTKVNVESDMKVRFIVFVSGKWVKKVFFRGDAALPDKIDFPQFFS